MRRGVWKKGAKRKGVLVARTYGCVAMVCADRALLSMAVLAAAETTPGQVG
jgi:hypothetical protein